MKILIATPHRNIVGGAETYVQAIIPALLGRGHQVAMLFDYVPPAEANVTVDPSGAGLPIWFCADLKRQPQLWKEIANWKADVVYSQGITSEGVEQLLQDSYPTVLYCHAYWGACTTGSKCHSFPRIETCTREFGPMCLVLHYPRRCGGLNPVAAWNMYRIEQGRKSRLSEHRAVLVASRHMYSEYQRQGVSPDKLHLVRHPVTDQKSTAPPREKAIEGRLLFLGRLVAAKGADFLIRAVPIAETKLNRKLTLTIAGDGCELASLQKLAAGMRVSAEFPGWVESAQKRELMSRADLLVLPSLWPEPFGLVGIEAGALSLPAAGFAVGGIPDWLIPGRTGELAPADPPTAEGLADAIARALGDPNHYADLCRNAFEFSQQFTLERHTAELERILYASAGAWTAPEANAVISNHV